MREVDQPLQDLLPHSSDVSDWVQAFQHKRSLKVLAMDTRLVVFLPTLQRVKSNFIVQNLKIKET